MLHLENTARIGLFTKLAIVLVYTACLYVERGINSVRVLEKKFFGGLFYGLKTG